MGRRLVATDLVFTRRQVLGRLLAAGASCALPGAAAAPATAAISSEAVNRRFSIYYKDARIGAHTVTHSAAGDGAGVRIATTIEMTVKVLFFTAFAFAHQSEEIWRDGRLMSLKSVTVEDGETTHVSGTATAQGFRNVSNALPFIAAPDALTSNCLWSPDVLRQDTLIDAQYGGVIGVSVRKLADERLALPGRTAGASRYRFITPYVAGSIWYDEAGRWVQAAFERDGAFVEYRLDA